MLMAKVFTYVRILMFCGIWHSLSKSFSLFHLVGYVGVANMLTYHIQLSRQWKFTQTRLIFFIYPLVVVWFQCVSHLCSHCMNDVMRYFLCSTLTILVRVISIVVTACCFCCWGSAWICRCQSCMTFDLFYLSVPFMIFTLCDSYFLSVRFFYGLLAPLFTKSTIQSIFSSFCIFYFHKIFHHSQKY